eukprot:6206064-Pleurochrysis_carterae.AAC.2
MAPRDEGPATGGSVGARSSQQSGSDVDFRAATWQVWQRKDSMLLFYLQQSTFVFGQYVPGPFQACQLIHHYFSSSQPAYYFWRRRQRPHSRGRTHAKLDEQSRTLLH